MDISGGMQIVPRVLWPSIRSAARARAGDDVVQHEVCLCTFSLKRDGSEVMKGAKCMQSYGYLLSWVQAG